MSVDSYSPAMREQVFSLSVVCSVESLRGGLLFGASGPEFSDAANELPDGSLPTGRVLDRWCVEVEEVCDEFDVRGSEAAVGVK